MIPDKIGRVIIDGVASAPLWANEHPQEWLHQWIQDTEDTFQWFLRDCSEVSVSLFAPFPDKELTARFTPRRLDRKDALSLNRTTRIRLPFKID